MLKNLCFKDFILAKITIGLFYVFSCIPMGINHVLGSWLGFLVYHLNFSAKKTIQHNITLCYPNLELAQTKALVKKNLQETGKTILEISNIWLNPIKKLEEKILRVENEKVLLEAKKKNKGVILLAMHHGSWEFLGIYLAKHYKVTNMYEPPNQPGVEDFVIKSRTRYGAKLAQANTQGVKQVLEALSRSEMVGILPDQAPLGKGSVMAPFFGHDVPTMTLFYKLAKKTGASVVLSWAQREKAGFCIKLYPFEIDKLANEFDVAILLNQKIEQMINEAPEQYQFSYRRFKHLYK